ncbi:MAG: M16 family metallopeptidase [Candidatus Methylomirabilaceae bacterium]
MSTTLLLFPVLVTAAPLAERRVLDSGLTLLVASRRALPIVTVKVTVRAGSLWEPEGRAGLANLTASLLTRGTATHTAAQIDEEADFMGASLSSWASRDSSELDLTLLKKDLSKGLELLADVLLRPSFPDGEIARKVQELKAALRKRQEDPGEVAREAFDELVFGNHPYGRSLEGSEASLSAITRDDIVRFYRALYSPERTMITVVGDVEPHEIAERFRTLLKDWSRGTGAAGQAAEPKPLPDKVVVKRIDRGVTQANIVLGHQGVKRDNPDYYALTVMNYILGGGGFSSRLVEQIRERKGWAYDVSSSFSPGLERGSFQVVLQTKNETAGPAVQEVLRELRRIVDQGVTDQELADAKAYLTGSFPLRLDTNRKLADLISSVEYYKLGLDYADRYPTLINAVAKADVLRVARAYLRPDRYVLVVVGDQSKAALPE